MAESLMSEHIQLIAAIDPQKSATSLGSDVVDMKKWRRIMGVIMVGAFATAGTLDAKFLQSATSNGSYTTYVASKSITQLTEAGTDLNKQAIVNLSAAEVAAVTMRWAKLKVTNSSTQYCAALIFGERSRYKEPWTTISYSDVSSVDEIVK